MGGYVGIPASYTPVEYIESSGTQYIDTGFKPNQNTNIQIDFQYLGQNSQVSSTTSICAAGARQIVASNKLVFWIERDTSKVALTYGTYDSGFINNTNCSQRVVLKNEGCSLLYNGTTVASSTSSNFTSIYNILLFGISATDGSADLRGVKMKLYSFKIWDNNTLARDFIPVKDQDNVACLYEQVEGKLYYNKGSGAFVAGSATGQTVLLDSKARKIKKGYVGVSSSYTPIEYLEGTGTQYINAGVPPAATLHCVVDFQLTSVANGGIIGGWEANKGMLFGINSSNFQFAFGTSAWAGSTLAADTNRHTLYMNDENNEGRLDNTVLATGASPTTLTNSARKLWLFRSNGGAGTTKVKIFSCQLYNGSTLYRNFVPALDEANRPCLYDTVEGKFYYNIGTGEFVAGQATGQAVSIGTQDKRLLTGYVGVEQKYTPVEYIENDGKQFIDTRFIPSFTNGFKVEVVCEPTALGNRYALCTNFDGVATYVSLEITANNEGRFISNNSAIDIKQAGVALGHNTLAFEYYNGQYKVTVNGTTTTGSHTLTGTNLESFLLFVDQAFRFSIFATPIKLYSCKIWDGNTLVRNFIPAIDQDNIPCLVDLVDERLYYNVENRGDFIIGSTTGVETDLPAVARKCYTSNIVPKGTIFLCNCDDNATNQIDGAETRADTTSGRFSFSAGKWGKQLQIKNTEISGSYSETAYLYSLRDGLLPGLYNIFQGTANPITLTCWRAGNAQNDGWSIAYGYGWFSRAEGYYARAYRCAAGVDILNNYLRIKIMYRNNSIQTASYLTDVPSTVYNDGQFHHYALEISQFGVSFYFDGVYKGTLAKPRYIHFRWYEQYDTIFKGR